MNNFINYLNQVSPLSDITKSDLKDCLKKFEFKKNETVLKQGQICNYLYFVNKGLLRNYYLRDGKEITDYFATEQSLIGGIDSFFSRQASEKIIEVSEPSELCGISFNDLDQLYNKHHDLEKVGRLLSIAAFLSMQKRIYSIQFHTAKQRYSELIEHNPHILLRVPLGQIASYLGITQVTLSRIRSER